MPKLEHIGIAVKNITQSITLFEQLLETSCYKTETVESEGVTTAFFQTGESKIELLEAQHEESPISKFIEKKGEGIHHIAFAVEHLETEIERLKGLGFQFINETPKNGADNKRIVFLHPKSSNSVLVELCEERK